MDNFNYSSVKLKLGSDCCGLQTDLLALRLLGVEVDHVWSCDSSEHIKRRVLRDNPPQNWYDDMVGRDHSNLPDIDLYVCGFPCPSWSVLGQRNGFEAKQGQVFYEVVETIRAKLPRFFVLENVKGITQHKKGKSFALMKDLLEELPYSISYHTLNTMDYGLPQERTRLYIIGVPKDCDFQMLTPEIELPKLRQFLDLDQPADPSALIPRRQEVVDFVVKQKGIALEEDYLITTGSSVGTFTRCFKDKCPTITAYCRYYYITSQGRFLTLRELMRLQGFPNDFPINPVKKEAYREVGNAMCVPVLSYVLASVLSCS